MADKGHCGSVSISLGLHFLHVDSTIIALHVPQSLDKIGVNNLPKLWTCERFLHYSKINVKVLFCFLKSHLESHPPSSFKKLIFLDWSSFATFLKSTKNPNLPNWINNDAITHKEIVNNGHCRTMVGITIRRNLTRNNMVRILSSFEKIIYKKEKLKGVISKIYVFFWILWKHIWVETLGENVRWTIFEQELDFVLFLLRKQHNLFLLTWEKIITNCYFSGIWPQTELAKFILSVIESVGDVDIWGQIWNIFGGLVQ